jgi:15-cis-phytoene synthase
MQLSQAITRKSASNLALAFVLLPKEKREGMAVLYAFCREIDDIADEESIPLEERRRRLAAWREDVQAACNGRAPNNPVAAELRSVIAQHHLPYELFDELIKGVEMDLDIHRYQTYEELEQYCYRVASIVGLLSIEIFGYLNPQCREYAVSLGKALQLTNILRDVRVDALRGRLYLPLTELQRFGVKPEEILQLTYSERYFRLAQSVAEKARRFYCTARELLPPEDRRAMATANLMGEVYWRLLQKLDSRRFNVFDSGTARLSKGQKLFLIFRTWYRLWTGALVPNYGIQ